MCRDQVWTPNPRNSRNMLPITTIKKGIELAPMSNTPKTPYRPRTKIVAAQFGYGMSITVH